MFTKRIIPCLDVNNGRVVKGINFVNLRDAGDPVELRLLMIRQVQMRWFFWNYGVKRQQKYCCGYGQKGR